MVDKVSSYYYTEVSNNLTDSNEVRNDEGEVVASSTIMEAKELEPHKFKERKAMALCRSFSCMQS